MRKSSPVCGRPAPLSSARPISTSLPTASAPPTPGGASLAIPTIPAAARAGRAAARRSPSSPASAPARSAPIPADRSGCRRRCAVASASSRRGLRVREVAIPEMQWTVATQLVTLRAEASALHARWIRAQPRAYGADVRTRLQLGSLVAAADYVLAQRMRARIRAAMSHVFRDVDVLLLPSTPIVAPVVGERTVRWRSGEEPVDGALVRLTAPFNPTGQPALSVSF